MSGPRYCIAPLNFRVPLCHWQAAIAWLLLDRFNAPGYITGSLMTLFALLFVVALVDRKTRIEVDLLVEHEKKGRAS